MAYLTYEPNTLVNEFLSVILSPGEYLMSFSMSRCIMELESPCYRFLARFILNGAIPTHELNQIRHFSRGIQSSGADGGRRNSRFQSQCGRTMARTCAKLTGEKVMISGVKIIRTLTMNTME